MRRAAEFSQSTMRVHHAEQALQRVYALNPEHQAGLGMVSYRLSRVRHLLWNGYHDEARRELFSLRHLAREAIYLNGESPCRSVIRFVGSLWEHSRATARLREQVSR